MSTTRQAKLAEGTAVDVKAAHYVSQYKVHITFSDGFEREVVTDEVVELLTRSRRGAQVGRVREALFVPAAAAVVGVLEPPGELGLGQPVTPHLTHQPGHGVPARRVVRDDLERHYFVEVPSAALNRRRACVPATVSLRAIRSQAPERTSSNVRVG